MVPLINPNKAPPRLLIQFNNSKAVIWLNKFSSNRKKIITAIKIRIKLIIFDRAWFHLNCFIKNKLKSAYQKIAIKIAEINPKSVSISAIIPLLKPKKTLNKIITRIIKSTQLIIFYYPPDFFNSIEALLP